MPKKTAANTRGAVRQDALRYWLERPTEALVREYQEGYRRWPEETREVEAAMAVAGHVLRAVDW